MLQYLGLRVRLNRLVAILIILIFALPDILLPSDDSECGHKEYASKY